MSTISARAISPDEFYRMGEAAKGFELVHGEMKELNMSAQSCRVGGQIYRALENSSQRQVPGWAFPPETGFQCFEDSPGMVRKPHASFIILERMTREQYEEDGFIEIVPDLVAEVISPNDIAQEVEEKLERWLTAGVRLVWVVNPTTRTVRIHRHDGGYAFLQVSDTITGDPVLPGFACPVADLFRLPGEPASAASAPV